MSKSIVLKLGGSVSFDAHCRIMLLQQVVVLSQQGYHFYIVHGGGKEINKYLALCNIQTEFVNGLRKTDAQSIDVIAMVLNGKVNKDIVFSLNCLGGKAVGLSGLDGSVVIAQKILQEEVDLGFVGYPSQINTELLLNLSSQGYCVVLSCIGTDFQNIYNINADPLALEVAKALQAETLIYITDVDGVLDQQGNAIPSISAEDIVLLEETGVIQGGMIPKLKSCVEGLEAGIQNIYIINGTKQNVLTDAVLKQKIQGTVMQ